MAVHVEIHDNTAASRFEFTVEGQTGVLVYDRRPDALALMHTEVPEALRGQHLGDALVQYALAAAKKEGRRIVPVCPFVEAYLQKHPIDSQA